jgi:hypothetical protein
MLIQRKTKSVTPGSSILRKTTRSFGAPRCRPFLQARVSTLHLASTDDMRRQLTTLLALPLLLVASVIAQDEAGEDTAQGMIEKVRTSLVLLFLCADHAQTVPLRTHSLAAPYVDSDLQNRWSASLPQSAGRSADGV